MRLREKEISDPQTIDAILQSALVCRIALAAGNAPYVVPVNFAVKDGVLYFHSALSGRKIDMLQQNASVCFEVDFPGDLIAGEKACSWSMKYQSVIGFGRACFIEENHEKIRALDLLLKKYSGSDSFSYVSAALDKVCVIGVKIETLSGKQSF
jgi:nitroimidazol reductase NimA-like FMN-containing flavoprotein (pyridoxamine 5'-phosphate oxidase superfamily)